MGTITRILIANRGEIAVRIARTAHRLGIGTVGVYAEPDRNALHTDSVDRAVALGGHHPGESYLRIDAVVQAALDTGCDAVHPGYGFLAENAEFARAVLDAGLTWVGPSPDQIALLGDKLAAKQAALAAGVPASTPVELSPGSTSGFLNPDHAASETAPTFPLLVKAAAGGGGRGMRVVHHPDDLADAVESASREARSAFGDGRVFGEPFIQHARHIEVQILGDTHGNVVHLGERECSIQRRHQKVVEEAPSAGIDAATRERCCAAAVALGRHVGYVGAGTVEFMVGADGRIDFLEVNTRLQVEHPVTEAVTGLDLVELQLLVAAGEPLPFDQSAVTITGHAIEIRLVAEDPAAGWLGAAGTLACFEVPTTIRCDAGVRAGSVVSADYDSLLAKCIAVAPTRAEATRVLARALRATRVTGVATNLDASIAICEHPAFAAADTPTTFLDDHPEVCHTAALSHQERIAHLCAAVVSSRARNREASRVWGFAPAGWRNLAVSGQRRSWERVGTGDDDHTEHRSLADDTLEVLLGKWPAPGPDGGLTADERPVARVRVFAVDALDGRWDTHEVSLEVDGRRHRLTVVWESVGAPEGTAGGAVGGPAETGVVHVFGPSGTASWRTVPRFVDHDAQVAGGGPVAPLPGTVVSVHVATGDAVDAGTLLVVLEAMKMEHRITAAGPALVTDVRVVAGDRVDTGTPLVLLQAPQDGDGSGGTGG